MRGLFRGRCVVGPGGAVFLGPNGFIPGSDWVPVGSEFLLFSFSCCYLFYRFNGCGLKQFESPSRLSTCPSGVGPDCRHSVASRPVPVQSETMFGRKVALTKMGRDRRVWHLW